MKYYVNENCIRCGLYTGSCSEVFTMSDEGVADAIAADVPAYVLDCAVDEIDECP